MVKAIGKLDVLAHPVLTIHCYGWRVFIRTLFARRDQTFLSILVASESSHPSIEDAFEIVRRCVRLEQAANRIYASLADKFSGNRSVGEFFEALARQEQEHAEILEACRIAAMRGSWDGSCFDPWRESVPYLERKMQEANAKLCAVRSPADAFWLTVEIESSEINQLFEATVAATDSRFVKELLAFGSATREHLDYIRETISELEPSLRSACERMLSYRAYAPVPRRAEEMASQAVPSTLSR
jgi:rubrerythrin